MAWSPRQPLSLATVVTPRMCEQRHNGQFAPLSPQRRGAHRPTGRLLTTSLTQNGRPTCVKAGFRRRKWGVEAELEIPGETTFQKGNLLKKETPALVT